MADIFVCTVLRLSREPGLLLGYKTQKVTGTGKGNRFPRVEGRERRDVQGFRK